MKDLINKMRKHRVEDKQAFKTVKSNKEQIQGDKGRSPDRKGASQNNSVNNTVGNSRPLSEPVDRGSSKKNKDYRIKNKVIKR